MLTKSKVLLYLNMAESHMTLVCSFHPQKELNLFCCVCEDIICLQCLLENHQTHEMKALSDSSENIQALLKQFLTTRKEEIGIKIAETKDSIQQELKACDDNEENIVNEILKCCNKMKAKVDQSSNDLTEATKKKNSTYKDSLQVILEGLVSIESRISGLSESKGDLKDDNWPNQVKLLTQIKQSLGAVHQVKTKQDLLKPRFEVSEEGPSEEYNIGRIVEGKQNTELPTRMLHCQELKRISKGTQTFTVNETDDATDDKYPIIIELQQSQKPPSKIIPISEENAWVICDNKLFKFNGTLLEQSVFTENVHDIGMFKDQSLLLLSTQTKNIKRLLKDSTFNFISTGSFIPQKLYITDDENVFVFMNKSTGKCWARIIQQFKKQGIPMSSCDFGFDGDCILSELTLSENNNDVYFLCHDTGYNPPRSRCVQLNLQNKNMNEFRGAIGVDCHKHFHCHGMCIDSNNKILVSDKEHHSILLVDDNMKYVKKVFSADDGLRAPTTITLQNGVLWIVDGTKLHKMKYCA